MTNTGGISQNLNGRNESGQQDTASSPKDDSFTLQTPPISLPKGGGALKNIDEKFQVNAINGTASFSVPLPFSKTRSGLVPALSLRYNSGSGNSSFGLGWNMDLPAIQRKTDKQLPRYMDVDETDVFLFSGAEDLVPVLIKDAAGNWVADIQLVQGGARVQRYRPRIEGSFIRIEKITPANSAAFYWRTTTGTNTVTLFGKTAGARIADPNNSNRIFKWLPELSYDDRGNCLEYEYLPENFINVPNYPPEQNRFNKNTLCTNTYLKRVKYGNQHPYERDEAAAYDPSAPVNPGYLFELVLDYGDHADNNPASDTQNDWPCRYDPFSDYHAGFDIRAYRLCRRVLFFHNFKELNQGSTVSPCLVRSLDLFYQLFQNTNASPSQIRNVAVDYIVSIQQSGYIRKGDGTYSKKSLPAVDFTYQELQWNKNVLNVSSDNFIHDPIGLGPNYVWTDLWSEGIPGILTEQGNGWFYKSNQGNSHFTIAQPVIPKPAFTGLQQKTLQLQDLEADGRKFIVSLYENAKGYFEISDDREWQPFRPFEQFPNVNFSDPNTKFIDLNGDGRPELVISEENVFVWYASKGIAGYDSPELTAKPFDEEQGPALVFNDGEQSIYLADMSGDGMTDIVRIRNGEVCYWPNMGYGRFGAKVNMNFAPVFDTQDAFNPAYLHLADISGTGATDILYLGENRFRAWLNLSGNAWSELQEIGAFPATELPNQLEVLDFLGNGTACIVWSSPMPGSTEAPMRYIDLMGGSKPYIMSGYKNNFGKESSWEYKSSTYFYLSDKQAGRPWVTKLPFPVQCVCKTTLTDRIAGSRFTNEYSYHHGYYDHPEREFRGFGRVEQTDTEDFSHFIVQDASNIVEEDLHQSPVKTINWFHTGAYLTQQTILDQFAHEYTRGPYEFDLPRPLLPANLTPGECREALRACKGMSLRQEIYALDGSSGEAIPYSVATHNSLLQLLQPQQDNKFAVFYVQESEAVTFYYERNLPDPRIAHTLHLEVDDFGNLLKSAAVVYGRKTTDLTLPADIQNEQSKVHVVVTTNDFTNDFDWPDTYRLKAAAATKTYELTQTGYHTIEQFTIDGLLADFASAIPINYEDQADGALQKRLTKQVQHIYLNNDLVTPLPPGQTDTLGFLYQSYKLALTPSLVNSLYAGRVTPDLLTAAKYIQADGLNWWISSGSLLWLNDGETSAAARARFYMPVAVKDPFDTITMLTYDPYQLLTTATEDALHNRSSVETIDYRTLSATRLKDMNDNISEVITDELGMVIATSIYGTEMDGRHGDGPLSDAIFTTPPSLAELISNPRVFLQQAGSFFYYDLFAWVQRAQPCCFASVVRETHISELPEGEQTKVSLSVGYSSGLGQSLQTKIQAEPGEALQWQNNVLVTVNTTPNLRWVGSGRTIVNNKGKPVKQYEPFFSATYEYEPEQALVEIGFSSLLYYDAPGRVIRVVHPNGTLARTEFDAWKKLSFDENDTVLESSWYSDRGSPPTSSPEPADAEQRAAWLTAGHAGTPAQVHLDSLGRSIYSIADNAEAGKYATRTVLDIENNIRQVIDARNNSVMQYDYDMTGRQTHTTSMDGAQRWTFSDAMNLYRYAWDSRSHRFRTEYDILHRPLQQWLKEDVSDDGPEKLIGAHVYGEGQVNDKLLQLRGRNFRAFDASGLTAIGAYDFKGNVKSSSKQLCTDYQTVIDWNIADPFTLLETQIFNTSSRFDAVNQPIEMTAPDNSRILPVYNEANLLTQVNVFIASQGTTTSFVQQITYNARAQREQIIYGNNTATRYDYDAKTYRLMRLLTTRNKGQDILQDLNYTYDPVGNITGIRDDAQQTLFFNNAAVDPDSRFIYDAVYRLVHALGREHAGQNAASDQFDKDKTSFNDQRLVSPGDMNAMQRYEQRYEYDEVGNMLSMIHNAGNGVFANKWTRTSSYAPDSNRLLQDQAGGNSTSYQYDAHGNMGNLQNGSFDLVWNYVDQLQQVNLGGGGTAYYVYDSSGRRVRKVIKNSDLIKERIYLNGFELYRESQNGAVNLVRETLHIMDGQNRIALAETRVLGSDKGLSFLTRYQYSNHLGTAVLETDDQANIISYEEYYPFGSTSYQATRNQTETSKRYRYNGKERDEETGLYYYGARYYAPWLARWISLDVIASISHTNRFEYVQNNPILFIDPDGKDVSSTTTSAEEQAQIDAYANKIAEDSMDAYSVAMAEEEEDEENKKIWKGAVAGQAKSDGLYHEATSTPDPEEEERRREEEAVEATVQLAAMNSGKSGGNFGKTVDHVIEVASTLASIAEFMLPEEEAPEIAAKLLTEGSEELEIVLSTSEAPLVNSIQLAPALETAETVALETAETVAFKPPPIRIPVNYTEALAKNPGDANFLRSSLEWAQSEGPLVRGTRLSYDEAFRKAARRYMIKQGVNLEGKAAMHPLDSVANRFLNEGAGTTYYFGDASVNSSFGAQLGNRLNAAGVKVGEEFEIEFINFPSYDAHPPIAPPSSPPDLSIRKNYSP